MTGYALLKAVHVSAVTLSGGLFLLRGTWMLASPQRLARRWVRVFPHVIDSILLASALALVVSTRQYPFVQDWLTAKVIALCVYIGLGSLALKHGRNLQVRAAAWLAALAVFAYMVLVALSHSATLGLWSG
jgi:uncharacterized membrane protein SirB2